MSSESIVLMTLLKHRRLLLGEIINLTHLPQSTVRDILNRNRDFIRIHGEDIVVVDPISIALKLLDMRYEIRKITEYLDWRDFEIFSTSILEGFEYEVIHPLKLTTPIRFEIDILGVDVTGFGIAIDCKHWSISTRSRVIDAITRHRERIEKLIKHYPYVKTKYPLLNKLRTLIPVILTLSTPPIRSYENTLVISIGELRRFLLDRYTVLEYFEVKPLKISDMRFVK